MYRILGALLVLFSLSACSVEIRLGGSDSEWGQDDGWREPARVYYYPSPHVHLHGSGEYFWDGRRQKRDIGPSHYHRHWRRGRGEVEDNLFNQAQVPGTPVTICLLGAHRFSERAFFF